MLDSVMFGSYCLGLSAILLNLARNKKQDEYEEYIKGLREFDLSTDKLRPEHMKNDSSDVLVLCKYSESAPLMMH